MRFIMMVKSGAKAEAGLLPDQELLSEVGRYNEELTKAGVILALDGLHPSSKASRVRMAGNKVTVIDGPFTDMDMEAKELLGGYWIIQVKSKQEAIEWAKRAPSQVGEIELRQLYDPSDFPVDATEAPGGWREQEEHFRALEVSAPPARKPGTTRFMVVLKSDKMTESGGLPDPKILSAMGELMGELARAGALLSGDGLKPSSSGARVGSSGESSGKSSGKSSGGKRSTVIDGPFAETKEMIAGYSIIQVSSKAEAIDFARRWLQIHADGSQMGGGEIDVRPMVELSDFPVDPAEQPDGWRDQEQRLRDRIGQR